MISFSGIIARGRLKGILPGTPLKNSERVFLDNDTIAPGTKLAEGADPYNPDSYSDFWLNEYSPDLMFTEIENFVEGNSDKPFFLYCYHYPTCRPPGTT
ncbi:MAG: hypothetical protein R2744_04855 [Bacteroidales bacterium]